VKLKTHSPGLASVFSPLTDSSSPDPKLFSDLESEISQLLASLASAWKNLSTRQSEAMEE
jgi:hypothetical protein